MRKFLKDILAEPNGKFSLTRTMAVVFSLSYLAGYFFILVNKHELSDIPVSLSMLISALYGINKFTNIMENKGLKN